MLFKVEYSSNENVPNTYLGNNYEKKKEATASLESNTSMA